MSKSFFLFLTIISSLFLVSYAGKCDNGSQSNSSSYSSSYSSSSSSSSSASSSSSSSYSSSQTGRRCPKNERFVKCPEALCIPLDCSQLGEPVLCPLPGPGTDCPGKPRCICIEGYVRSCNGICIPKKQCPSCGGDSNARAGCGFDCAKRCICRPKPDPCYCDVNGSECKPGYIYDDIINKCVKPEKCTKSCPANEVYSTCANGGCGRWNCTQVIEPMLCIDPIRCIGGCVCQEDYLRARNGTCIPTEACYIDICEKPNEIYDNCTKRCPPRTCGIDDRLILCAPSDECLEPACRCQNGYYRNNDGYCVLWEDCPDEGPKPDTCSKEAVQLLEKGNVVFNGRFLYEAYQLNPGRSMIMSPFSVFVPLGEMGLFSEEETYSQIMTVLNLRNKADIRCVFPRVIKRLREQQNVVLNLAARVFTTDVAPPTKNFLDATKNIFDAPAESLDFTNGQASADRINQWVANETNDRIKDIATPDMFSGDTRLVLANAIYYLGNWVDQFNVNDTEDRDFHVDKQTTIKIPTMYQKKYFDYSESSDLDAKMLRMYYKGQNFSFFAILPNDVEGLPQLIDTLQDSDKFEKAISSTSSVEVKVYLPKIEAESEFDLSAILKKIGVIDLFDASKAKLTNILQYPEPLSVSAAKQKAFCKVDETGTEAAAANIITVSTTSAVLNPPPVYIFDANRNFVFYILNEQFPIFSGVFAPKI